MNPFYEELNDIKSDLDLINKTATKDLKGSTFDRLAELVDHVGPRVWGSKQLDIATDVIFNYLTANGFKNVVKEPCPDTPVWTRGREELILHSPRPFPTKVPVIGLGGTIGGHVQAQLYIVNSYDELVTTRSVDVKGKIVLINKPWTTYPELSQGRLQGPTLAASKGAVACLVRSLASNSIGSPHTGITDYNPNNRIPAAAIATEDADMFARMFARGDKIVLELYLEGRFSIKTTTSYNILAELPGNDPILKSEVFVLGGHIDSWDAGAQTGANDDGAGFWVCIEAVRALIKAGIQPKRTIRFVGWAGEEFGDEIRSGYRVYANNHKSETHIAAFESDEGTRKLTGFGMNYPKAKEALFNKIKDNFATFLPDLKFIQSDFLMVDVTPLFVEQGIPCLFNIDNDDEAKDYYFSYHHSAGDSMSILKTDELDGQAAGIAQLAYLIANS